MTPEQFEQAKREFFEEYAYGYEYGTGLFERLLNSLLEQHKEVILADTYPKEFVEWKDKNTMTDRISRTEMRYMLTDLDAPLYWWTLDEIFNYWLKNVNNG